MICAWPAESSGASQPGVLPLEFLLHLAARYWVACRGMQGSRNAGGVTSGQCGAHDSRRAGGVVVLHRPRPQRDHVVEAPAGSDVLGSERGPAGTDSELLLTTET